MKRLGFALKMLGSHFKQDSDRLCMCFRQVSVTQLRRWLRDSKSRSRMNISNVSISLAMMMKKVTSAKMGDQKTRHHDPLDTG